MCVWGDERQKCAQIAVGKVMERNKWTQRDNKLMEDGWCTCVREREEKKKGEERREKG